MLLTGALADCGVARAAVTVAGTLRAARQQLSEGPFDCILLDLELPDATGLQAVQVISTAAPGVPIVVVSALPGETLVFAAMAEGADEYLYTKDLRPEQLHHVLVRANTRRAGSRRIQRSWADASSILDRISSTAAVIDGGGRIIAVNAAWREAALAQGGTAVRTGPGVNYLAMCDFAAGPFSEGAADAAAGIRSVLRGDQDHFVLDYPCHSNGMERWFSLRVTPFGELGGGAIVVHLDITELVLAESALRGAPATLALSDPRSAVYGVLDGSGLIVHLSDTTADMLDLPVGGAEGTELVRLLEEASARSFTEALRRVAVRPGSREPVVLRVRGRGQRWRHLDVTMTNLVQDPGVQGIVLAGSDITEARLNLIRRRTEARLFEGLPLPVLIADDQWVILQVNQQAELVLGRCKEDLILRSAGELELGPTDPVRATAIGEALASGGRWEGEYEIRRPDGSTLPVRATMEAVRDADIGFDGYVVAWMDISDRRQLEDDLAFQALHDPLTGLPNRRLFLDHMQLALARSDREPTSVAVLFLDIDDFTSINERLGHRDADEVLRAVGDRLSGVLRGGDFAARFGGDEFLICCAALESAEQVVEIAEALHHALSVPVCLAGQSIVVSASVGIAFGEAGTGAEALIANADAAMQAAKATGKGRFEVFDEELARQVRRRCELAVGLDLALEDGSLRTDFQPQFDLTEGSLVGFEALARWEHPVLGAVPPAEFVPIAEHSGRIDRLGEKVLSDSCAALRAWMDEAPERVVKVAVNVSPRQLLNAAFPRAVAQAIDAHRVPAGRVCLEITESALIDPKVAADALRRLRSIGVEVAIDDFGTGYSSLSRLHRFPIDYLKVDRSFVAGLGRRAEEEMIVTSVISLARGLGLRVIAEGIDEQGQLDRLAALGCDLGQGFLMGEPMRADAAIALVVGHAKAPVARPDDPASGRAVPTTSTAADVNYLLGLLAHELAGPITAAAGWAEIVRTSTDPAEIALGAASIRRATSAAQAAVDLVRDAAASDSGTLQLRPMIVDLGGPVRDAIDLTQHLFDHPVEDEVTDATVYADPERLVGALVNLLTNAAKHASPRARVCIRTEHLDSGRNLLLHVVDDGPGVPDHLVRTIFRRFARGRPHGSGSGLGLYVARAVARAQGGDLYYQPAPDGGADFVLEIPLGAAAEPVDARRVPLFSSGGSSDVVASGKIRPNWSDVRSG
jgi:diguanylate cyclase (GGDEF)-like protein/PAS domain S-box-containing protein